MTLYAGLIGINQYQRSPLRGCVPDARNLQAALEPRGFQTELLLDGDATRPAILEFVKRLVAKIGPDDLGLLGYSGHGSKSGGAECWVSVDMQPIWDKELRALLVKIQRNARFLTWSDSCHGGGMARARAIGVEDAGDGYRASRFLEPEHLADPQATPPRLATPRTIRQEPLFLFAACKSQQVTWDANIDGQPQGCFTWAGLQALRELEPAATNKDWYRGIRTRLPSEDYDNQPVIDGTGSRWYALQASGRR